MDALPMDIAEEMRRCAWAASWHASNERKGYSGDAKRDEVEFKDHADEFKKKATGLLSSKTCDDLKWMFWYAGWYAANKRWKYNTDAGKDEKKVEGYCNAAIESKEISKSLAHNIKEMGVFAGWYCANTRYGYHDDAKADKAKVESYFKKIAGKVELIAMNFYMDTAQILSTKPKAMPEEELINNSDIDQTMSFAVEITEGKTNSVSHTIAFEYSVGVGFEAGFFGFGKSDYEVSFAFSHSHTFEQSIQIGVTKTYTFPLTVPQHSTYVAHAIVQEAHMTVDYDLVLRIGGVRKTIQGTWDGVAVSRATYEVNKLVPEKAKL